MKVTNHLDSKQLVNDAQVAPKMPNDVQKLWDNCSYDTANLVFIDVCVEDREALLYGLLSGYQAVNLSADQDGVEQITYLLSEFKDVESIHIVSHGRLGALHLGSTQLDRVGIKEVSGAAKELSRAFGEMDELGLSI